MEQPNLDYINQIAGNDDAFRAKLIATIQNELPQETSQYKSNIEAGNYAAAAGNVHKLKHKISVMGMEKSYYLAESFETNLQNNTTNLKEEFEQVLVLMQEYISGF